MIQAKEEERRGDSSVFVHQKPLEADAIWDLEMTRIDKPSRVDNSKEEKITLLGLGHAPSTCILFSTPYT